MVHLVCSERGAQEANLDLICGRFPQGVELRVVSFELRVECTAETNAGHRGHRGRRRPSGRLAEARFHYAGTAGVVGVLRLGHAPSLRMTAVKEIGRNYEALG